MMRSDRLYRMLLWLYPTEFRREYAPLMAQVFSDMCRDAATPMALLTLWGRIMFDLALTLPKEHLLARGYRRATMMDNTAFDYQLGETMHTWSEMLRSGYSLKQVVERLAQNQSEPAASEFKQLLDELNLSRDWSAAFENLLTRNPSPRVKVFVATVLQQMKEGGNLADRIDAIKPSNA